MSIHILPSLLPNETIYSVVARIGKINGYQSDQKTCEKLFGKSKQPRVADTTTDFEYFSHATRNAYGVIDELVRTTTCIHLFTCLGLYNDPFYKQMAIKEPLGLATYSNGYPHRWRWCNCCVKEDINTFGLSYWHRNQQLPGVFVCTQHKTPLLEAIVPFRMRQKYFMYPYLLPNTIKSKQTFPENINSETALNLALFIEQAVLSNFNNFGIEVPLNVIVDQLQLKGFITKGGMLKKPAFINAFHGFLESFSYIEEVASLVCVLNQHYLSSEHSLNAPSIALRRVLLIYWLFGNWDLFLEHCSWRNVFVSAAAKNVSDEISIQKENTVDHYKVCINFLKLNLKATKSDFWRAYPKSCRWLLRNDKYWAEQIFNTQSRSNICQLDMFNKFK